MYCNDPKHINNIHENADPVTRIPTSGSETLLLKSKKKQLSLLYGCGGRKPCSWLIGPPYTYS